MMMRAPLLWVAFLGFLVHAQQQPDDNNKWVELDYKNLQDTIEANEWTCVLLYDPWDERGLYEHTLMLEGMYDRFQARDDPRVGFARLNGRRHAMIREEYTAPRVMEGDDDETEEGESAASAENPFARDYYENQVDQPNALLTLNNETLLDVALGTPYWPAQFLVLANNYNVYGNVDLSLLLGAIPLKTAVMDRWLSLAIAAPAHEMEPLVETRANLEAELAKYTKYADNDFNFVAYQAAQEQAQRQQQQQQQEQETPAPRNVRLLLETDSKDDKKVSSKGFFTYRKAKVKKVKGSSGYMSTLGTIIEEYLAWCEGYETTWSEERKQREDEQTNFGVYLDEMNQALKELIHRLLDEDHPSRQDPDLKQKMRVNKQFAKQMRVPNLKGYFEEAVFGTGRSVARFREFFQSLRAGLGETAQERRRNRYDFNTSTFPLVTRLRESLTVYAEVDQDDMLYSMIFADLVTEWHNILRTFHKNLNQHYVQWVKENPRPHGNEFQFQTMDIIDMKDPANHDLLSTYNEFHERYTKPGTPVILSNVEMSRHEFTLDYIVQECSAIDVTPHVQLSRKVGERQAGNGWGGLTQYVLEDELLTFNRKKKMAKKKGIKRDDMLDSDDFDPEYQPSDDEEDVGDGIDRSLTMKQFAVLHEKLEHLYLHDYGLPDRCDRILFDDGTPYSRNQKFKIPSVIASWDLNQRMPQSKFWSSWPSLFVGRKGSNSKLHLDSGATGFFMYLVSGRKRWIVYNRDERVHLYEKIDDYATYPDVLGMGKDDESNDFLSNRFPLLHRTESAYEIIQEPGQLVYIPPSCPHAVENLEDIIGLAMNLVPREGMANHFHEQMHSQMDYAVFDVAMNYWLFEDTADQPIATDDPLYTTYAEYKAQY